MAPVIPTSTGPPVDSLLRRLAVEVFVVGLRVVAGMVDDAVPMIRRRIERVELQRNTAGIDDVVIRPSRDDDREARSDRRPNAIENRLTGPLLHAKELVERVDFRPDLFLGLQRHDDELAVLRRVKHPAKLVILDGEILDVLHKAFHNDNESFFEILRWVGVDATHRQNLFRSPKENELSWPDMETNGKRHLNRETTTARFNHGGNKLTLEKVWQIHH